MKKKQIKKWIKYLSITEYGSYIEPNDKELGILVDLVCQDPLDTVTRNPALFILGYTGPIETFVTTHGKHKLLQFLNAALLDYPPTIWERMWTLGKQLKSKVLQ